MAGLIGLCTLSCSYIYGTGKRRAVIGHIDAALGAVIATALLAAVVEQLCHLHLNTGTARRLDRNTGATHHLLTEVKDQIFACAKQGLLASVTHMGEFGHDLAKTRTVIGYFAIKNRALRLSVKGRAHANGLTDMRNDGRYFPVVKRRLFPCIAAGEGIDIGHGRIAIFAIPDIGSQDLSAHRGIPALIGGKASKLFSISVKANDLSSQCDLVPAIGTKGDTAAPPTVRNGSDQRALFLAQIGDVIIKLKHAAGIIRPAGLHFLVAHATAVDVNVKYAESGCGQGHPFGACRQVELAAEGGKSVTGGKRAICTVEKAGCRPRMLLRLRLCQRVADEFCIFDHIVILLCGAIGSRFWQNAIVKSIVS